MTTLVTFKFLNEELIYINPENLRSFYLQCWDFCVLIKENKSPLFSRHLLVE